MDGLLYQNALRRVARVLDQHAAIVFGDEPVVPRTYIPALVGTSREMTGRVLRLLESDGVVERIGRDRLRLLDRDRLTSIAAATVPSPADRSSEQVPRRATARSARVTCVPARAGTARRRRTTTASTFTT